ncbi:MAG TPA: hypothetical protein VFF87_03785, partial [Hyphomicrobium sp.]|nr:hypothetical protein [Hyphomicrobium sp.]
MLVVRAITVGLCHVALLVAVVSSGGLCVVGAFYPAPAYAQGATIQAITVHGNKRVEPETVRSYLQFSTGSAYDPA